MRHPTIYAAAILAISTAVMTPLRAQEEALDRDMRFVRGLAKDLGFIALAQNEVARLRTDNKSGSDQSAIALLGIEVAMNGAKGMGDRERKRVLFEDAMRQCKEIVEAGDSSAAEQANVILAQATYEFGQFLAEELTIARQEAPSKVAMLEELAANVYREGVQACDAAMATLEGPAEDSPEKALERNLTWLRKGVLLREQARTVRADRDYLAERAREAFEELIFEVGEETALGLRSLFELSVVDEVVGDLKSAGESYADTIESINTSLDDPDLGLSPDTLQFLGDMCQEVYVALLRVQYESGDTEKALALGTEFKEWLKKVGAEGAEPFDTAHPWWGHQAFLWEARTKAESGQTELVAQAMETAKLINEKHPRDFVGLQAKAVIKAVLEAQSSLVSGALLFEIAKGEYQANNYEGARNGLKRALASMSPEEGNTFGGESWYMIATSYALEKRFMEAVMAYCEGLEKFGPTQSQWVEKTSDKLESALTYLKRQTKNDPALSGIMSRADGLQKKYAPAENREKRAWKDGNRLMAAQEFEKAAQQYAQVQTKDFTYHDLAKARFAYATALAGKLKEARAAIADFRKYLASPESAIADGPKKAGLEQVRAQAIGELDYREAYMDYREAMGAVKDIPKDLSKFPGVIAKFQAFITNHSDVAPNFVPYALDALGRLQAGSGKLAAAETSYETLKNDPRGATLAAKLVTVIFLEWKTQADNLAKEVDAAFAADKRTEAQRLDAQLAEARRKLLSLGLDYARASNRPQYGVMANALTAARALGNWGQVDTLANKVIEVWGSHPDYQKKIDSAVRPMLGESALQREQYQVAYDMLSAAEKANPKNYEVKRLLCRALGGWLEFDTSGNPLIKPGLGRYEEAYKKYFEEYRVYGEQRAGVERYSLPWYQFQYTAFYYAKRASKNKKFANYADRLFKKARGIDDFGNLKAKGKEGVDLVLRFRAVNTLAN